RHGRRAIRIEVFVDEQLRRLLVLRADVREASVLHDDDEALHDRKLAHGRAAPRDAAGRRCDLREVTDEKRHIQKQKAKIRKQKAEIDESLSRRESLISAFCFLLSLVTDC